MSDTMTRANGELSRYAFGCGYIQSWTADGGSDYYGTNAPGVSLYLDGVWHVKAHTDGHGTGVWETFDTYTEARAYWGRVRTALRAGRGIPAAL